MAEGKTPPKPRQMFGRDGGYLGASVGPESAVRRPDGDQLELKFNRERAPTPIRFIALISGRATLPSEKLGFKIREEIKRDYTVSYLDRLSSKVAGTSHAARRADITRTSKR